MHREGVQNAAALTLFVAQRRETELAKLRAVASPGYARGQLLPRDRKDWYDRWGMASPLTTTSSADLAPSGEGR
jgi:hypothetical protein